MECGEASQSTVLEWDRQIRIFAEVFLDHARLPAGSFTLLDVGCGTGAALRELRKAYPKASLYGCDVEQEHVDLATRMNGDVASFFRAELGEVDRTFDVIYASNVIEHVEHWHEAILLLARRARRVYLLVPYKETLKASPAQQPPRVAHLASFGRRSFDSLKQDGFHVVERIVRTPGAWGERLPREIRQRLEAFVGLGPPYEVRRQLLVSITGPSALEFLPTRPFRNRLSAAMARFRGIVLTRDVDRQHLTGIARGGSRP